MCLKRMAIAVEEKVIVEKKKWKVWLFSELFLILTLTLLAAAEVFFVNGVCRKPCLSLFIIQTTSAILTLQPAWERQQTGPCQLMRRESASRNFA